MIKKERAQKSELRREWKRTGVVHKKEENWQKKPEKQKKIQTGGKRTEKKKNRKRIVETRNDRIKKREQEYYRILTKIEKKTEATVKGIIKKY